MAVIGLGANLGEPLFALRAALRALQAFPGTTLKAWSAVYRSSPVDADGPDYLNAAALLDTHLAPLDLLAALLRIEADQGRKRPYRNAPRTLDLDLLLFGDRQIDSVALTVPHPRLHQRAFALMPLLELLPDARIPGRGRAKDFLGGLADQKISRVEGVLSL